MKTRHNKKRNTAFVYEALIREATVAILKKDLKRRDTIVALIKEHFNDDSLLKKELQCYRALYETRGTDHETSGRILKEAKLASRLLDPHGLFKEQSALIKDINKELDSSVFNGFVPNYKTLATISQIFSDKISPKDQVLLENEILKTMTNDEEISSTFEIEEIDNVLVKTFIEKFNNKYQNELLSEQKELLTYYISSFADNALQLKVFLNTEISRLKTKLEEAKVTPEIESDSQMVEKTDQIIGRLNEFAKEPVSDDLLLTVLKTQNLVKEIYSNGRSS